MTFEVGRLSAALTLDGVDQFHRDLDGVGGKFTETAQRGSSFGKLGADAFRQAAGAATGLVTAAGAYLGILTKTGVAYNSLQQNSRAALSVLLGGTEQANAQMSKLDDFARNSPFSKGVFIQAQQQLIGFGMEAAKVIPTLDAIQQGVAAMGGSNEQISEVVNILAKVQSTGKFTAETLNELGYRGIDAATLMGDAMGKSAAQIRDDISDAAIGGSEAIDILVGAMQTRFGGAADGVKEQWTGATDRIKAASRDLGAHIAEPFVSAQGGGMAVSWANQVADVLRAIEKQAVPVMGILTQRGMPFFAALTQGLDSSAAAIQRWNPASLEDSLDRLAAHAPGIAATAGAVLALGANVGPLGRMLSVLGLSANPVLAAFVGLAATSPELRDALGDLLAAGKPLLPLVGELAVILSNGLSSALPLAADGVELLTAVLRPVIGILEDIPAPVLLGVAAFLAMQKATQGLSGPLGAVTEVLQRFGQQAQVQAALGNTTTGVGLLSTASMRAQGMVGALGAAMKTAFLSNPIGLALTAVATIVGAWAAANAAAQQKVEDHRNRVAALRDTLNETTGALTEATEAQIQSEIASGELNDKLEKIGISSHEATQAVLSGGRAYQLFKERVREAADAQERADGNHDLSAAHNRAASNAIIEALDEQVVAREEAQRLTREAVQAARDEAAAMSDAARSNQRFNDALQVARDVTQDMETRVRALKQALDELKGGEVSAEEAAKRLSETNLSLAEGLAQTDEAGTKLWQSTLDGAGNIDIGSRAGLAFADSMGQARDRMLDAAMAASDQAIANGDLVGAVEAAKAAGDGYIETLRQTMADAGLTQEQIDGLVGKYLDVPSTVATLLTDNGTISEVDQRLIALAMQIEATPDKSITISEPLSPEIISRLEVLGYKVTTLPDGNIQVTETGAASVENTLNHVARNRETTISIRQLVYKDESAWHPPMKPDYQGGLYGPGGQHFAAGGFASGIYRGVVGGIPKMGVDGRLHIFGERELGVPWETYISGNPAYRSRNIGLALETLRRLAFPVVPVSALGGVPRFATGGIVSTSPRSNAGVPSAPAPAPRQARREGPLVGTVVLGNATRDQFTELENRLDFYDRGGR